MWCDGIGYEKWMEKFSDNKIVKSELFSYSHEWARQNAQSGDSFIIITDFNESKDCPFVLHCTLYRDGNYSDVRGTTKNFKDVLEGFEYSTYNVEVLPTLELFNSRLEEFGML